MQTILNIENVNQLAGKKTILKDVNFSIEANQIVGFLGHNGAGKSTLLRKIANQEKTKSGTITVDGQVLDFEVFRDDIVLITGELDFPKSMTVKSIRDILAHYRAVDQQFITKYFERLGIDQDSKFGALSQGNQEMAQLVLMLAIKAKLYLLDEPFSAIDIFKRDIILEMIIETNSEDNAIIITTHLIQEVQDVIERIIYINNGVIDFITDIDEIAEQHESLVDYLKYRYTGGPNV